MGTPSSTPPKYWAPGFTIKEMEAGVTRFGGTCHKKNIPRAEFRAVSVHIYA